MKQYGKGNFSGPDSSSYADPSKCCYLSYTCAYCNNIFHLVQPDNFMAGGAIIKEVYRNKATGEEKEGKRIMAVCMSCAREMMREQQ
jgi:hypothetical protein